MEESTVCLREYSTEHQKEFTACGHMMCAQVIQKSWVCPICGETLLPEPVYDVEPDSFTSNDEGKGSAVCNDGAMADSGEGIAALVSAVGKKVPFATTERLVLDALFACGATVDGGQKASAGHVVITTQISDEWPLAALASGTAMVGPVTLKQVYALWGTARDDKRVVVLMPRLPVEFPPFLDASDKTVWLCVNVPTVSAIARQLWFLGGGFTVLV